MNWSVGQEDIILPHSIQKDGKYTRVWDMGMVKESGRDIIRSLEWEEIYYKAEAIFEKIISKSFPKLVKELKWIILTLKKKTINAVPYLKKKKMIGLF